MPAPTSGRTTPSEPIQALPESRGLLRDIDILNFGSGDWKTRILREFGTDDFADKEKNRQSVFGAILDLAHDRLGATSVVLENYTSTDWADEYKAFYSRVHRGFPRFTTRMHFFRSMRRDGRLTFADVMDLESAVVHEKVIYLGYCVLRPFIAGKFFAPTISEAILAANPPRGVGPPTTGVRLGGPAAGNPVWVSADFAIHFLGARLGVRGYPFTQQDDSVSICADADIWMVGRYLHAYSESRRYRPSEIEEAARKVRRLGSTRVGLDVHQVAAALDHMNLNPDCFTPESAADALQTICAYVSSRIPVLAAVGHPRPNHIVTIIGAEFGTTLRPWVPPYLSDTARGLDMLPIEAFCEGLILHDDGEAPYKRVRLGAMPSPEKAAADDGKSQDEWLTLDGRPVHRLFIPIPHRVNLRPKDVQESTDLWLNQILPGFGYFKEGRDRANLVLRTFLRRSHILKRDAAKLAREASPRASTPWGLEHYWRQRLPKNVWVVELIRREMMRSAPLPPEMVSGELLFDSTCPRRISVSSLLSVRLGETLLYRRPGRVNTRPSRSSPDAKTPRAWNMNYSDLRPFTGRRGLFGGRYQSWTG